MNARTLTGDPQPLAPSLLPTAARAALALLQRLPCGLLLMRLPDGSQRRFGPGGEPSAAVEITDAAMFARLLRDGDIGLAEAFIDGQWRTPDLPALLRLALANREALQPMIYGRWWSRLAHRLQHLLNRNSKAGSRRNIHAHYDLGNPFYRLWLDETWSYSSALFDGDFGQPLAQAQRAKVRRALDELRLQPGHRLLEIGCGWGTLAGMAAKEYGAQVVGLTLSTEQLALGRERLAAEGLSSRAELRLQDYRDLQDGPYDAVVSIEMFEAVGEAYWPAYFRQLRRQLKPGGRACVQSITLREDLFDRYRTSSDFIQQYIFPGGMLPTPAALREQARRAGLTVVAEKAFGRDYAETLRRWRTAFAEQEGAVRGLGFDQRFLRIWDFYLAYCEAGFDSGCTDVVQFTLT